MLFKHRTKREKVKDEYLYRKLKTLLEIRDDLALDTEHQIYYNAQVEVVNDIIAAFAQFDEYLK